MKKNVIIIAFFLSLGFATGFKVYSQTNFETAIEYNDFIMGLQREIANSIQDFVKEISEGTNITATASLNNLVNVIDDCILKLNNLEPYEGNTEFRDAAKELFKFYKSVAQNEYQEFKDIKFKEELSEDDYDRLQAIVDEIGEKEEAYDDQFSSAQSNFADQFNFTIFQYDNGKKSTYTEPEVQKGMPQNSLETVKRFLDYMIKGDQENMKALISPEFRKANKLDKVNYRVNNYGLAGYIVFAYNDSKKEFTAHIWGEGKNWVHELTFKVAEVKGKWYIVPSSFDGEWVDPWTNVIANINE